MGFTFIGKYLTGNEYVYKSKIQVRLVWIVTEAWQKKN